MVDCSCFICAELWSKKPHKCKTSSWPGQEEKEIKFRECLTTLLRDVVWIGDPKFWRTEDLFLGLHTIFTINNMCLSVRSVCTLFTQSVKYQNIFISQEIKTSLNYIFKYACRFYIYIVIYRYVQCVIGIYAG